MLQKGNDGRRCLAAGDSGKGPSLPACCPCVVARSLCLFPVEAVQVLQPVGPIDTVPDGARKRQLALFLDAAGVQPSLELVTNKLKTKLDRLVGSVSFVRV